MISKFIVFLVFAATAYAEEKVVFTKVTNEDMKTVTVLECTSDIYDKMFSWNPVTGEDYSVKQVVKNAKLQLKTPSGYKCELLGLMLTPAITEHEIQVWYYNVAFQFAPTSFGIKDGLITKVVPMLADGSHLSERVEVRKR